MLGLIINRLRENVSDFLSQHFKNPDFSYFFTRQSAGNNSIEHSIRYSYWVRSGVKTFRYLHSISVYNHLPFTWGHYFIKQFLFYIRHVTSFIYTSTIKCVSFEANYTLFSITWTKLVNSLRGAFYSSHCTYELERQDFTLRICYRKLLVYELLRSVREIPTLICMLLQITFYIAHIRLIFYCVDKSCVWL